MDDKAGRRASANGGMENDEINRECAFNDDGLVYKGAPWKGVSCVSYLWPYAGNRVRFEVKRAVLNLTSGMRYVNRESSYDSVTEDPDVSDVLQVVKAASDVLKAADATLREAVAEAVASGATWERVGEALGVKKAAAHKRFRKGLSSRREREIAHDGTMVGATNMCWLDVLGESRRGFDESDWEAAPVEVVLDHAFRTVVLAFKLFGDFCNSEIVAGVVESGDGDELLKPLRRSYDLVGEAFRVLSLKRTLVCFVEYTLKYPAEPVDMPWVERNAPTYFMYGVSRLASAWRHFTKLWSALRRGGALWDGEFARQMVYVHCVLGESVEAFTCPEVMHTMAHIEQEIVSSGNSVFLPRVGAKSDVDMSEWSRQELFDVYWKNDSEKIAECLGVAEIEDPISLEETLDWLEGLDEDV